MELELGLKISRNVDDLTTANLVIAKDRAGPAFVSRETDTMFILTAHLKGYKREYIKIEINEDGTQIAINGEKPVQETVMVGWKVYKNEIEMRGFKKVFKIPDGVNLDKIKARFKEEESTLTISMPKLVKGISGIRVEEVEEVEAARASPESSRVTESEILQQEEYRKPGIEEIKESDQDDEKKPGGPEIVRDKEFGELGTEKVEQGGPMAAHPEESSGLEVHATKKENQEAEKEKPSDSTKPVIDQVIQEKEIPSAPLLVEEAHEERRLEESVESTKSVTNQVIEQKEVPIPPPLVEKARVVKEQTDDEIPQVESEMQGRELEREETPQVIAEPKEDKGEEENDKIETSKMKDQEVHEPQGMEKEKRLGDQANQARQPQEKRSSLCVPIMAGSAFLVTIIVLVIHLSRTKSPPSKKRD
ncbi:titin homolog [Camellia sinensis]|uniref:titin homolog n=1 Tax=Camellia sinensis TaxID=4442 RepID=UPI0010368F78|nr:titin homolog [Camellia sinensis]